MYVYMERNLYIAKGGQVDRGRWSVGNRTGMVDCPNFGGCARIAKVTTGQC